MKCEVCLELLEEYLDGELAAGDKEQVSAHLKTCTECFASFSTLSAEAELFSRYDRELDVPPFFWTRIAQHTVAAKKQSFRLGWRRQLSEIFATGPFVMGLAIVLFALAVLVALQGVDFVGDETPTQAQQQTTTDPKQPEQKPTTTDDNAGRGPKPLTTDHKLNLLASAPRVKRKIRLAARAAIDQSDVLSSNLGYLDIDDRDTAKHIEQTQNLLRSVRNFQVSEGDEEIDVSYDKALSRRLLNENVVLRRDAEMKAKFPTKSLLADVEPFLIDIANLPDHARSEDVRVIKERMQKTEIVAALMGYQERSPNNR